MKKLNEKICEKGCQKTEEMVNIENVATVLMFDALMLCCALFPIWVYICALFPHTYTYTYTNTYTHTHTHTQKHTHTYTYTDRVFNNKDTQFLEVQRVPLIILKRFKFS